MLGKLAHLRHWVILALGLCAGGQIAAGAEPFPCEGYGTQIGSGLPAGYEPSGAARHDRLNVLFVVSDGGRLSRLDAAGDNVTTWNVTGDLEAVCVADPESDYVYIGVEQPDSILEFDLVSGVVRRTFDLTPWMTGPSNHGLEALTFVPDESHPEGGLFYAGLQEDGLIYVFELPIVTSSTSETVTYVDTLTPSPGRTDLSGLDYHRDSHTLYAIFDSHNVIRAVETDMTFLAEWALPGNDQEGIARVGCELFVAEDVGKEVWKYLFIPDPGDLNGDTLVTLDDFEMFAACLAGPNALPSPAPPLSTEQCLCAFDFDGDDDVDACDFAGFTRLFSGG